MIIKETTVFCDICGNWERVICSTQKKARRTLQTVGWVYRSGKDICDNCVEKEKP